MRLLLRHIQWMTLELWRQPTYMVSTVAFPSLFYLIFAVPESKTETSANFLMASFSGFAFFGVVFLQFGVSLAQEKSRSWYTFLKTLPFSTRQFLLARFVTSMIYGTAAVAVIIILAFWLTPVHLTLKSWVLFAGCLFLGSFAFCLMGVALGFWASEKTALPLGNLIYLPLSFAGGLWKPPELLPATVQQVSVYLPTRLYGDLLWASVGYKPFEQQAGFGLVGFALVFATVAYFGYLVEADRKLSK